MNDNIVIKNKYRNINPLEIGVSSTTKIITNIGLVPKETSLELEFEKARKAVYAGSDAISDVSIDVQYMELLKLLVDNITVPIATVPLYGVCVTALKNKGAFIRYTIDDILQEIEKQARLGVDVMTFHVTPTRRLLEKVKNTPRIIKISSRGGSFVAAHMIENNVENLLYQHFSEVLDIVKQYDITVSIGSSLRPASVYDGLDNIYIDEILTQGEIVEMCREKDVRVIVEGIGHMPLNLIPVAIKVIKNSCNNVPIRPLPIATDIAAGYDHIAAAIAASVAAMNGAELLSVITRGEHIGLPRLPDVVEGVRSFKIAAHIGDIARLGTYEQDKLVSIARNTRSWVNEFENCLFPDDAANLHGILSESEFNQDKCTMCGSLCALKITNAFLKK